MRTGHKRSQDAQLRKVENLQQYLTTSNNAVERMAPAAEHIASEGLCDGHHSDL